MSTTSTLYGQVPTSLLTGLKHLKLIVFDVDGVFSDGRIYMGNQGEELKTFHTLDGYGIKAIMQCDVDVAVITGRQSKIVQNRMSNLGVKHIVQGQEDKEAAILTLQAELNIMPEHTAAMGDDMPDLGMFKQASSTFGLPNGHPYVNQQVDYVTSRKGGDGAVREVCDLILQAKGELRRIHGASV